MFQWQLLLVATMPLCCRCVSGIVSLDIASSFRRTGNGSKRLMTDAERLTKDFIPVVNASPFRIAPERRLELLHEIFNGTPWNLCFRFSPTNFWVDPQTKDITVSFSSLLSIWATAHAALIICDEAAVAMRANITRLDTSPGSNMRQAIDLIEVAKALIRDPSVVWPTCLPFPNPNSVHQTVYDAINNLFLGAVGWIILHEVAHVILNHQVETSADLRRRHEHEADSWATEWIFKAVPDEKTRAFRIYATATALSWIGFVDDISRVSSTHPHASERFGRCLTLFSAPSRECWPRTVLSFGQDSL
jgi:hypothetical protein